MKFHRRPSVGKPGVRCNGHDSRVIGLKAHPKPLAYDKTDDYQNLYNARLPRSKLRLQFPLLRSEPRTPLLATGVLSVTGESLSILHDDVILRPLQRALPSQLNTR